MSTTPSSSSQGGWLQLLPFFIFIIVFSLLHITYYSYDASLKSGFALFSVLVGIFFSIPTFSEKKTLNQMINIFVQASTEPILIYMGYIFILSSVFTHILEKNNGVQAAVDLGLHLIPPAFILPGIFTTVSIFALIIGSSMGSIAAFIPIASGVAHKLGMDPALLAATVVGASMLGDNLSIISDTTVAATQTTGCVAIDKFKENSRLVLPAFIITFITLAIINIRMTLPLLNVAHTPLSLPMVIKVIPYICVFGLVLLGIDVLIVLTLGSICGAAIGIMQGSFTFVQATSFLFEGFYSQPGMVNVFILVFLMAGLTGIIYHNQGLAVIVKTVQRRIRYARHAEYLIALLIFCVNAAVAINTIAILITGPIAKQLGARYGIAPQRVASILDIFACVCQGLMPYTPQLLLAGAMAGVSSIALIPYLYYQFAIAGVTLISIALKPSQ